MCILSHLIFCKLQARGDRNECRHRQTKCCCSEWFAKCKRLHWSKKHDKNDALKYDDGGGGDDDGDNYNDDDY
jgi:hypothetical protein